MTAALAQAGCIPVEPDELDSVTWRASEEALPYMREAALEVQPLARQLLRTTIAAQDDEVTDERMEEVQALALAAHLRVNRLPEAIYAHGILLALAERIMRQNGSMIAKPWADLIDALADYIGTMLVYQEGQWVYHPRAVLV